MPVSQQDRISLSHPETFQDLAKAHAIFTQLRREEPVAWCPEPWGGQGFWSITKYDDIRFVSKTPQLFANEYHVYVTAARIEDDGDPHVGSSPSRRAELRRVDRKLDRQRGAARGLAVGGVAPDPPADGEPQDE